MKRGKLDTLVSPNRLRLLQIFMGLMLLYLIFMTFEIPLVLRTGFSSVTNDVAFGRLTEALPKPLALEMEEELTERDAPSRPLEDPFRVFQESVSQKLERRTRDLDKVSSLIFNESLTVYESRNGSKVEFSELHKAAKHAWQVGTKFWDEMEHGKVESDAKVKAENRSESCPLSISLSVSEFRDRSRMVVLPCGLTLWSHITVVATPKWAHPEKDPKISIVKDGDEPIMVSQFMMELQGLKTVDNEDPPRILHFNPRLKGDWSGRPVIEQNTCYRMQWGTSLRCEGWKSRADEETVDGQVKCEKWIRDDDKGSEESKAAWWLKRLIGRTKKVTLDWPYPFAEGKLFVLTISAGLEGYHVSVDGRHITSFPYRTGFVLEDATGLTVNGDIDVHSVFAASLPSSHPSFAPQRHLELLPKWKASPVFHGDVELFIGILSAGNHFAERMAVRKSWMQHELVKSSNIVARFFVALSGRKEVNIELKKEAEYFGDIVIVPYMDHYDLVVLKTIAICEYGVRTMAAKYIMKCDDDTFVRVDSIINEARKVSNDKSLYIGNMNYHHRPLRSGKWAVTFEEWAEEEYPIYANGPGYILSSDIGEFIVSGFEKRTINVSMLLPIYYLLTTMTSHLPLPHTHPTLPQFLYYDYNLKSPSSLSKSANFVKKKLLMVQLFKMEDVSMGMWVEKFNSTKQVEYVHSLKFCQFGCIENYYTAHYQSPRQMTCMWEKLQIQGKPLCCNMR